MKDPLGAAAVARLGINTSNELVRYCPECGTIGPVPPGKESCCPDSFGMSMRRWQAEKMERVLDDARGQRRALSAPAGQRQTGLTDEMMAALRAAETVLRQLPDVCTNWGGTRPTMTTRKAEKLVSEAIDKATRNAVLAAAGPAEQLNPVAWGPAAILDTPTDDASQEWINVSRHGGGSWNVPLYASLPSPQPLRMLTEAELGEVFNSVTFSRGDHVADAVQRKFIEVNGLPIPPAPPASIPENEAAHGIAASGQTKGRTE